MNRSLKRPWLWNNVKLLHFDQGPMGHVKKKLTTLAAVHRDIQALDGVRGPPSGGEAGEWKIATVCP